MSSERRRIRRPAEPLFARLHELGPERMREALALEKVEARQAGALGFLARTFVQATLPHRRCDQHEFERTNGHFTLHLHAPPSVGTPLRLLSPPHPCLAQYGGCAQAQPAPTARPNLYELHASDRRPSDHGQTRHLRSPARPIAPPLLHLNPLYRLAEGSRTCCWGGLHAHAPP